MVHTGDGGLGKRAGQPLLNLRFPSTLQGDAASDGPGPLDRGQLAYNLDLPCDIDLGCFQPATRPEADLKKAMTLGHVLASDLCSVIQTPFPVPSQVEAKLEPTSPASEASSSLWTVSTVNCVCICNATLHDRGHGAYRAGLSGRPGGSGRTREPQGGRLGETKGWQHRGSKNPEM